MKLLLFDIDGTLLHSRGAGKKTMTYAQEQVFGTAGPIDQYQMAGKTDLQIIHDLMQSAGIAKAQIATGLQKVYQLMAAQGRLYFGSNGIVPCAGVTALLDALAGQQEDALLGLLTGNIVTTAPLKLQAAGLDPNQFRLGAYGSDHADRNRLPAVAWQRAQALTGRPFAGSSTVIIGDTPADIACARASGSRAVAVASGSYSAVELAQLEPDILLDNLLDTKLVLRILLQSG